MLTIKITIRRALKFDRFVGAIHSQPIPKFNRVKNRIFTAVFMVFRPLHVRGILECKFFCYFCAYSKLSWLLNAYAKRRLRDFSHSHVSRVSGVSTIFSLLITKRASEIFLPIRKNVLKGLMTTGVTKTQKFLNFFVSTLSFRLYSLALKFCNLWRDSSNVFLETHFSGLLREMFIKNVVPKIIGASFP